MLFYFIILHIPPFRLISEIGESKFLLSKKRIIPSYELDIKAEFSAKI